MRSRLRRMREKNINKEFKDTATNENVAVSIVVLNHVTKIYGDHKVIDDLCLEVKEGEFLSIIGPSGCGKSTTLRMIGGFLKPTEGTVYINGENVTELSAAERDTSMVFQDYALFPHMSILDNVAFGLKMAHVPKKEREERAEEVLRLVGLAGYGKRKPSQLSGGQRQRVALARSIVMHPHVLLLDEPLGALDAQIRRQMQVELKHLQRSLDQTFIYVTHDQEEAMTMSDRILLMQSGVIRQCGTPAELYDSPTSVFAARFLGECSIIDGMYDGTAVSTKSLGKIEGRLTAEPFTGDACICLRPEKLTVALKGELPQKNDYIFEGIIVSSVYKGLNTRLHVQCCDETFICEVMGHCPLNIGAEVVLGFSKEDAVIVPYEAVDTSMLVSRED